MVLAIDPTETVMNKKNILLNGLAAFLVAGVTTLAHAKKGADDNTQTNGNSSATNNNGSATNSNSSGSSGKGSGKAPKVELLSVQWEQKTWLRPAGASGTNWGEAEIEVKTTGTNSLSRVKLEPRVLAPDTYTVTALRRSDSNTVVLGTFDAVAPGTNTNSVGVSTNSVGSSDDEDEIVFGTPAYPLPAGLSATDIARLTLAGTGTNVPLVADFSDVSRLKESEVKVSLPLTGPSATGKYSSEVELKKGKSKVSAKLEASKLPANAVVSLVVNGASVGGYTVDKKGGLKIEGILSAVPGKSKGAQFPVGFNPLTVQTIALTGAGGTNLLSGTVVVP